MDCSMRALAIVKDSCCAMPWVCRVHPSMIAEVRAEEAPIAVRERNEIVMQIGKRTSASLKESATYGSLECAARICFGFLKRTRWLEGCSVNLPLLYEVWTVIA